MPTRNRLRSIGLLFAGAVIGGVIVFGALVARVPGPKPPTPPLLKDVSAGGGWWGACPPATPEEASMQAGGLALSPELNKRLARLFPVGSLEGNLLLLNGLSMRFASNGTSCLLYRYAIQSTL